MSDRLQFIIYSPGNPPGLPYQAGGLFRFPKRCQCSKLNPSFAALYTVSYPQGSSGANRGTERTSVS